LTTFRPKDFIETADGLRFAVVAGVEDGNVLCFLRYVCDSGGWRKVGTEQAKQHVQRHAPAYRYYSQSLDAHLHAVPIAEVVRHYCPQQRLSEYLRALPGDAVAADLQQLCGLLLRNGLDLSVWGVTGSLLIGTQSVGSDIDLVCYQRNSFHQARAIVRDSIGQNALHDLADQDWLDSYRRRGCDLSIEEYIRHERRKCNKALINGRKFDLSLMADDRAVADFAEPGWKKNALRLIEARIVNDALAYDYPAVFQLDHAEIDYVLCYTATYYGQAQIGERVAVAGLEEQAADGRKRLLVGSSREAPGEYLRVVDGDVCP
jgi:uncharacterized protein